MKRLLILVLFTSMLQAQGNQETEGLKNGRFWNNGLRNEELRHAFILGLVDTWEFRNRIETAIPGRVLLALRSGGNFRTDELSRMVTSVYSEVENVELPIGWVVVACLAVQRGEADRGLALSSLRKHLTSFQSRVSRGVELLGPEDFDPLPVIFGLKSKKKS